MFTDNGDRKEYESLYFERRNMLLNLIAAELCEKEGRFIKKIMELAFLQYAKNNMGNPGSQLQCIESL